MVEKKHFTIMGAIASPIQEMLEKSVSPGPDTIGSRQ